MNVAVKPHDTQPRGVPGVPRPEVPAHIIKDDVEAILIAKQLAADFLAETSLRDRERLWPVAEVNAFSQSAL